MDLVVVAGTIGPDASWTQGCPRTLLPLPAGRSLLDVLLDRFEDFPGSVSAVCANGHTELIAAHTAERVSKRRLVLFEDGVPRGAAGCLKACAGHLTSEQFFVVCGSVWLDDDPEWMLDRHRAAGNALTVFCTRGQADHDAGLTPAGVYCCERSALDCIRPTGYQDLKEQWVPALQEEGRRVGAVVLRGGTQEILAWPRYLRVFEQTLVGDSLSRHGYGEMAPGVWCGHGVRIATTARIVGPVVIGHDCTIGEHAVIIGPTMLGDGSELGPRACVLRLLAPGRVNVPPGSSVADRLVPTRDKILPSKGVVEIPSRHRMAMRIRQVGADHARGRALSARIGASSSTSLDQS